MSGRLKQFLVAAVASALAAVFVVAVGPGFSEPNDNAADQAVDATSDESTETTEVATTDASTTTSTQEPHDPVEGNDSASNTPDTHGHVGSGTGTSTGSQADPGHHPDQDADGNGVDDRHDGTDNKSNGPGTGDEDANGGNGPCPNDKSSKAEPPADDNDFSGSGANTSGPYNSTCDGDNSENGQGSDAPGKGTPCAGCVGNADDKNPPGQVREFEGKKPNDMGYECDGNQGVGAHYGRGNPAHTGDCAPAPAPTTTPTPTPTPTVTPTTTPTPTQTPFSKQVCRQEGGEWKLVTLTNPDDELPSDKPSDFSQCQAEVLIKVCRFEDGGWKVVQIDQNDRKPTDQDEGSANCVPVPVCRNVNGEWKVVTIVQGDKLPTDMPPGAAECAPPPVFVCRETNGTWAVVGPIPGSSVLPGDKVVTEGFDVTKCAEIPPPPPDNPIYVCRETTSGWMVIPVTQTQLLPGDKVVTAGFNPALCEEASPPPPTCPTDMNPDVDGVQCVPPNVCPEDSVNFPGQVPPGGDMDLCDEPPVNEPPENNEDKVCPADSDFPNQRPPGGDMKNCDDEVLGGGIDKVEEPNTGGPGDKGDVLADRTPNERGPLGGVLPFTGTSILAYLIVALQLIGAGALIMRGRKAKR